MRDRFESNITGFSQQDGTEAHGKVHHPSCPFADMGEFMRESRPCMHFEEYFREINPWKPRQNLIAQFHQACWLFKFIEARDGQCVSTVHLFHTDHRIRREVGDGALIGGIELLRACVECRLGRSRAPVWSKNSNALFSRRLWVHYHPLLSLHSTVVSPILPTNERQQWGWVDT
jgi:hypothetical protein